MCGESLHLMYSVSFYFVDQEGGVAGLDRDQLTTTRVSQLRVFLDVSGYCGVFTTCAIVHYYGAYLFCLSGVCVWPLSTLVIHD